MLSNCRQELLVLIDTKKKKIQKLEFKHRLIPGEGLTFFLWKKFLGDRNRGCFASRKEIIIPNSSIRWLIPGEGIIILVCWRWMGLFMRMIQR